MNIVWRIWLILIKSDILLKNIMYIWDLVATSAINNSLSTNLYPRILLWALDPPKQLSIEHPHLNLYRSFNLKLPKLKFMTANVPSPPSLLLPQCIILINNTTNHPVDSKGDMSLISMLLAIHFCFHSCFIPPNWLIWKDKPSKWMDIFPLRIVSNSIPQIEPLNKGSKSTEKSGSLLSTFGLKGWYIHRQGGFISPLSLFPYLSYRVLPSPLSKNVSGALFPF